MCFSPRRAAHSVVKHKSGKQKVIFLSAIHPDVEGEFKVKCGRCIGCRIAHSREWAIRCMHEASLHEESCFLTLTYRKESLPPDHGLHHKDFSDFIKRLRRLIEPTKVRYYMCGEYGDKRGRPHFHALLFGYDFKDKVFYKFNELRQPIYTSASLEERWGHGGATIGAVTYQSAAYCARYSMKKIFGDKAEEHYRRWNPETGQIFQLRPEYNVSSNKPGIAKGWFDKFKDDVYPSDFVLDHNNKKCKPPAYYDRKYEELFPELYARIKELRCENADKHVDNNTPERLAVREKVLSIKLEKLHRNHDKEEV